MNQQQQKKVTKRNIFQMLSQKKRFEEKKSIKVIKIYNKVVTF